MTFDHYAVTISLNGILSDETCLSCNDNLSLHVDKENKEVPALEIIPLGG
jgi:hypothetical protein